MNELDDLGLIIHKGVVCREDTYDVEVVNEAARSYGHLAMKDKVIFDIGGCIGEFTVLALESGASKVIVYEPLEENLKLLHMNVDRYGDRVVIVPSAIGLEDVDEIPLYVSKSGKNFGNTSTQHFQGRNIVTTSMVDYIAECDEYDPQIMKIDCEGAEYEFLLGSGYIPDSVTQVVMELHLGKRQWREELAPALIDMFKDWKCVRKPTITTSNWFTLGSWSR